MSAQMTTKAKTYTSSATITRPANADAYTALDVIGGAITFSAIAGGAEAIMIESAELEIDVAAVPAGMTTMFLYLYNVTPPSAIADNAAFDLPSGDRASFIGKVGLGTPVDEGATLYVRTNGINARVNTAGTAIYGYLLTTAGFTPAGNSEVYKITLHTRAA